MPDPAPAAIPGSSPGTLIGPDGFPVSGFAAQAAAATPAAPAAPAAAASTPALSASFLVDRPRSRTFDLAWPVEVAGVAYRQVVMRRLTTGEVAAFVDRVRSSTDGANMRFPMFCDAGGALLSDVVWNALDPDDTDAMIEAGDAFLPARFRGAAAAPVASTPSAPATTDSLSAPQPDTA